MSHRSPATGRPSPESDDPQPLSYAAARVHFRLSRSTLLFSAIVGVLFAPACVASIAGFGELGLIIVIGAVVVLGIIIGRRSASVRHALNYSALAGITGAVGGIMLTILSEDPTDRIRGLSRFLGIFYSIIAGAGLFVVLLVIAAVSRRPSPLQ